MKGLYVLIAVAMTLAILEINSVYAQSVPPSVLDIDPAIIETNDTTNIKVTQDVTVDGTAYLSYNVTEPDGDVCKSAVLGSFGAHGSSNIRVYPSDFVINIANGDGLCNTMNTGNYDVSIIVRDVVCTLPNPPGCPNGSPGEPGIIFQDTSLTGQFTVTPHYTLILQNEAGTAIMNADSSFNIPFNLTSTAISLANTTDPNVESIILRFTQPDGIVNILACRDEDNIEHGVILDQGGNWNLEALYLSTEHNFTCGDDARNYPRDAQDVVAVREIDFIVRMFVIPEFPIGGIAAVATSLAALGGYLAFKIRKKD